MAQPEDLEKTIPTPPQKAKLTPDSTETQRVDVKSAAAGGGKKGRGRVRWLIGSVVGFIVFVGLGALGGMGAGLSDRQSAENLESAIEAVQQFNYGVQDLQTGNCDLAAQRFKYVIELDPSYPGIVEKFAQAMLCAGGTATPTALAFDAPTATPDLRAAELIYTDVQSFLAAQNWDQLLLSLDSLRTNFPDFHAIEIDGMYYVAYRNRGVNRILQIGDLEGGIFDLNRAAQIGPLDAEADTYRQWAISYIVGQSFWEIDWTQAVQYFQPLAAAAPNLHDLNFFTAQDRLATAVVGYAQELISEASRMARDKQWCSAEQLMNESNGYNPFSPEVQPTADWYTEKCASDGNEAQ